MQLSEGAFSMNYFDKTQVLHQVWNGRKSSKINDLVQFISRERNEMKDMKEQIATFPIGNYLPRT
jgi:DNA-binding winged helix-turn-helix (wHTH) protein